MNSIEGCRLREYTRYAVQELVQPQEFEKIISEIIFNLSQDSAFPGRNYPDIRYIGGNKDYGHDSISITWESEEDFTKVVFAFSKRKDWQKKLKEDLSKHRNAKNVKLFVFITTERAGAWKLPEKSAELKKDFGFAIEIIDIEDIVLWLDNTSWGKSVKSKYGIDSDEAFIYLKPNDSTLQDWERSEEFFRIMGPIEIDFIKGTIFRRDEVDSIIAKIKENRIHLIIGPPASGKTVLARNICYELDNLYNIYWLEMDDLISDATRVYLEITRLNRTNSLIVVENGHKSIEKLENLVDYLLDSIKAVKMIITTRNSNLKRDTSHKIARINRDEHFKTEINATDIARKLIIFYSDKFGKTIDQDIDEFLTFGGDLWQLSYLFKAYIDKGKIDYNIIYQKVRDELIEYDKRIGIGASDIILIIAWITQNSAILPEESNIESNYLPIDDFFLIDKLGYDPAIISCLTSFGIIKKVNGGYWCWHTSLSRIYIKTAELYPNLLSRINSKFKDILNDSFDADSNLDMNINIFHIYLLIHPEYTHRILSITSMLLAFKWPNILNNLNTRNLIYISLRKGNLEQINSMVHIINIFPSGRDNRVFYEELIDELGPDRVRDKICECKNPNTIVSYAYLIYRMNKDIGFRIIEEFKGNIINNFKEMDLFEMGSTIEFIFEINPSFAEEIINTDNLFKYRLGLMSTKLSDLAMFLIDLDLIGKTERRQYQDRATNWLQEAQKFLDRNWTYIKAIIERDKEEESIGVILRCISYISHLDAHRAKEAASLAGESYIISRLNEIKDLSELRYTIYDVEYIYPEFKNLILREFAKFIEKYIKINGIYSVAYIFGKIIKDSNMLENREKTFIQISNLMDENIIKTMKESSVYPFCTFGDMGI
jgi:hypothetical protein